MYNTIMHLSTFASKMPLSCMAIQAAQMPSGSPMKAAFEKLFLCVSPLFVCFFLVWIYVSSREEAEETDQEQENKVTHETISVLQKKVFLPIKHV